MTKEYVINSKKYGEQVVLLDDEDYNRIIKERYSLSVTWDKTIHNFYVAFTKKPEGSNSKLLHRYLLNPPRNMTIDHINRNPLDNRRCNLRVVTQFENNQNQSHNTTGKVGVTWHKKDKVYRAYIKVKGKQIVLGSSKKFEEAVKMRISGEKKYYPDYKGGDLIGTM